MRSIIEHDTADREALERKYGGAASESGRQRMAEFYEQELARLKALNFDELDQAGRIDYLLLRTKLEYDKKQPGYRRRQMDEISGLIPFAKIIVSLDEGRRGMTEIDPEESGRSLMQIQKGIETARSELEETLKGESGKNPPGAVLGNRAADVVDRLRGELAQWNRFHAEYDPVFTWWTREAYVKVDRSLWEYSDFLRKRLAGFTQSVVAKRDGPERGRDDAEDATGKQDGPVIGDPMGREALLDALVAEMIPYSPEELIAIAEREFVWCDREMKRAARDLGCGEDWHAALAKVSAQHVRPGEQPRLIKQLAEEATKFIEERQLVTLPPLCKETWRMKMMTPERQKVNPYFTGGEVISVSYPTEAMSFEDKQMSMRGNNAAFCRATVFHELIPGHHLQIFMAQRYNAHRRVFTTPFLVEGWALYWEMRMWDLGFPRTPEERVGMLFWRAHRCARIIFSLKFHLGQMTAQQAIDFIVDRVGHERRNATAEVRRSFNGMYSPLYQAAYLLGGLQFRQLHAELVDSGRLTERQFHDAILRENAIPVEMIRASLSGEKLTADFRAGWKFYPELKPEAGAK